MKGRGATLELGAPTASRLEWVWARHIAVLAALVIVLLALNWPVVLAMLRVWEVSPTYSHCFFIIPVSGVLVWLRRDELATVGPKANALALLIAFPVLALQVAGTIFSVTEVQQFALVGLIDVLVFSLLGKKVCKIIGFPLLFLFFLVPTGDYLVAPMQEFTAWFISVGLSAFGILHHTEGVIIELVGGTFRVAEACAGLRFLIATVAIGALFCYLNYRKWWKIALYMFASLTVPILANGLRALGIVLLAHYSNNKIATGADHLIYGWGFSVLILGFLMFVGARFADPAPANRELTSPRAEAGQSTSRLLITALLAGMIVLVTPAFSYWNEHRPAHYDPAPILSMMPREGWVRSRALGHWTPVLSNSDGAVRFAVSDPRRTSKVDLSVYYYSRTSRGHGLISSTNALWDQEEWHLLARGETQVFLGSKSVTMQEILLSSGARRELIWWSYWVQGKFTISPVRVKLASLQALVGPVRGSAFVAISTEVDSDLDVARGKLDSAARSLGQLPSSLDQAAGITSPKGGG